MDYSNRNRSEQFNDTFNDRDQNRGYNDENYGQNFGDRGNYGRRNQEDRNWRDENMSGQPFGRRHGGDWEQGYGNDRNFGSRGYGYEGGNFGRNRSYNTDDYNSGRGRQNYDRDWQGNDRGWWDRTKDEVSSWFGDDDAERRRRSDKMSEGLHRGKGPKGYKRSDERIKDDVNDRLSDDPNIDASNIEVSVSNGEVTLSGSVDSRQARRHAEDLAEAVSGVSYVQNNLRVGQQTSSNTRSEDVSFASTSNYTAGSGGLTGNAGSTGSSNIGQQKTKTH